MRIRDSVLVVLLVPLSFACHASLGLSASTPEKVAVEKKDAGDDAAEEKESKADKVKKAERALDDARVELKIARQECEAAVRKQKDEVSEAEYEQAKAREALDQFQKVAKPLELQKLQLSYDRSLDSVEVAKAKLEELLAMYKAEDVASATKELVLQRGRKGLEFESRALEQDRIESEAARNVELPRKEKDLELALAKSEHALREARAAQARLSDENELKLRKAERAVDDAEKDLTKQKNAKDPKEEAAKAAKAAKDSKESKDAKIAPPMNPAKAARP